MNWARWGKRVLNFSSQKKSDNVVISGASLQDYKLCLFTKGGMLQSSRFPIAHKQDQT